MKRCLGVLLGVHLLATAAVAQMMFGVNGGSGGGFSAPGAFLAINQNTGAGTILGTPLPGVGLTGVATDSSGRIFASSGTADSAPAGPRLIEIDPATGNLLHDVGRLMTAGGNDCYVGDLSFQPGTDALFGILGNNGPSPKCGIPTSSGGYLVRIDVATALVTVVGRDPSLGNANGGIAFSPNGTLYFAPCWDNPGALLTLDPHNANILSTTPFQDTDTCYMGLGVRPQDGVVFASYDDQNDDNNIYILNPQTGARVLVGSPGNFLVHDLTFLPLRQQAPALSGPGVAVLAALLAGFGIKRLRTAR